MVIRGGVALLLSLALAPTLTACAGSVPLESVRRDSPPAAAERASITTVTIVVEGDSNSDAAAQLGAVEDQRWPMLLRTELQSCDPSRHYALDNRAQGGWSTGHVAESLDTSGFGPHTVYVVMLGTNDVMGWGAVREPPYPYEQSESEANLRTIITRVKGTGAQVVLVAPPPTAPAPERAERVSLELRDWTAVGFGGDGYYRTGRPRAALKRFVALLDSLGREYDVPVVPIWDDFAALGWDGSANTSTPYVVDGVHLSVAGHAFVAGWVKTVLDRSLDWERLR